MTDRTSEIFKTMRKFLGAHRAEVGAENMQTQKEFQARLDKMNDLFDEQVTRTKEVLRDCDERLVSVVIMHNAHVLVASFVRDIIQNVTGVPTGPKGIETFLMLTAHQAYADFEAHMKEREKSGLQ